MGDSWLAAQSCCLGHPSVGTYSIVIYLCVLYIYSYTETSMLTALMVVLTLWLHVVFLCLTCVLWTWYTRLFHVCVPVGVRHKCLAWPFEDKHACTHAHTVFHYACIRVHLWIMNPKYQRQLQETRYTVHTHSHQTLSVYTVQYIVVCVCVCVFWDCFICVFVYVESKPDSH